MGDVTELTTWPRHIRTFYKVTSSAMAFEVKASGNAAIGLSRKPGRSCDYYIVIGERQTCWIQRANARRREFENTPGVLSPEEYRKFWVTWGDGRVCLGRDGEAAPMISHPHDVQDMKYVSFSVIEERNPVYWRFELPPASEKVKYNDITSIEPTSELHWVKYENGVEFSDEPLVGGYEGENLYIARAKHRGSVTPGKFVASKGKAFIPWGGDANEKLEFEVLCGFDGLWVSTCEDNIPVGAFVAGYSEDALERLFIGRARVEGHLIPGKVAPSHKVCYVPYNGKEVSIKKYEILVLPKSKERYVNKLYVPDEMTDEPEINDFEVHYSDYSNDTDEENVSILSSIDLKNYSKVTPKCLNTKQATINMYTTNDRIGSVGSDTVPVIAGAIEKSRDKYLFTYDSV